MQGHPSPSPYCTNTSNLQKMTLLPPSKRKALLSQLLWKFCRRKSAEYQSLPSDLSFYYVYQMSSCSFRFLMVPGFSKYYQRPQIKLGGWGQRASSFLCRTMSQYTFTFGYSTPVSYPRPLSTNDVSLESLKLCWEPCLFPFKFMLWTE